MHSAARIHRTLRPRVTCIHLRICKLVIEAAIPVTSNVGLLVTDQSEDIGQVLISRILHHRKSIFLHKRALFGTTQVAADLCSALR
jgi:hypothetical protein